MRVEEDEETESVELVEKKEEKALGWYVWALIVCVDIIGPFSTDSFIPNLPEMAKQLGASEEMAGLTLQANWLAKGLATVFIGGMSDGPRFGRRGTISFALFLYVIGAAGCSIARNVRVLIMFRIIQGIGESCTVVCSAIARDVLTDVAERVRIMAMLGTLRPIAIVLAPTVGGLLGTAFGWRNVFRALAVWGASLFIGIYIVLPETRPEVYKEKRSSPLAGFGQVLYRLATNHDRDHRLALASILLIACGFAGVMSFLSTISFLAEDRYGLSVTTTSFYMGSIPCIIIFINIGLAHLFRKKKEHRPLSEESQEEEEEKENNEQISAARRELATNKSVAILKSSLSGLLIVAVLNFVLALGPRSPLRTHFLPFILNIYFFALNQSPSMGPAMALAIQPFPDVAGAAASVNNIARTIFSTGMAQLATDLTAAFGVRALFLVLASSALASQSTWLLLPRNTRKAQDSHSSSLVLPLLEEGDSEHSGPSSHHSSKNSNPNVYEEKV